MDDLEIENMARFEGGHWWYRGLRDIMGRLLRDKRFALPGAARVLDAGCGTGENLCYLKELLNPAYLGGFDKSARAVELCRMRTGPSVDVYLGDLCTPEVHVDRLDMILSCDVICIPGVAACMAGLRGLVAKLRAGGLFILNLPALHWLRSGHDRAVHTRERFNGPTVKRLLSDLGLRLEYLTYRVFWLFPAILLRRLPAIVFPPTCAHARSDLKASSPWLNESLYGVMRLENWLLGHGIRYPWGSSILAVGRKEARA